MEYCRVETANRYTVMSNYHLRDKWLSLKARDLLSQILSLPEKWDITISGLSKINRECSNTIAFIIRELETTGYITRYRERRKNGTYVEIFYDIRMKSRRLDDPKRKNSERVKPKQMSSAQLSKEKSNKEKENKELFISINLSCLYDIFLFSFFIIFIAFFVILHLCKKAQLFLPDFFDNPILASQGFHFLREFEFILQTSKNIFFCRDQRTRSRTDANSHFI